MVDIEEHTRYINYIIGVIGGLLSYALGGYDQVLEILITMVVIDYMTGLLSAYVMKQINSDIGRRGIVKKVGIFLVVAIARLVDGTLGTAGVIRSVTIWFYISKEGISAIENLGQSGVPIPRALQEALQQLNEEEIDSQCDNGGGTMKICIDPGHGGEDPGANYEDILEKKINLDIALKLQKLLDEVGHEIVMTREDDIFVELYDRVKIANESSCDILISIHSNAAGDPSAQGTETLHYPDSDQGQKLAELVQDELIMHLQRADRGVKARDDLAVLKGTTMPAILVECGFISNSTERHLLQSAGFQHLIAESIVEAIQNYFEE